MCYTSNDPNDLNKYKNKKDLKSILEKTNSNFENELKRIEDEKFKMFNDFDLELYGNNGIDSGYSYTTEEYIDTKFSDKSDVFDVSHYNNNTKSENQPKTTLTNINPHDIDMLCKGGIDNFVEEWVKKEGYNKYHKDKNESYFRKILSNNWDILTNWSINIVGNQHFAVTINMPLINHANTHLYNYDNLSLEDYSLIESQISKYIFNIFTTTTYIFIVPEKNEKGILHFHILVSIRNFIDYNYTLKDNLSLSLKEFDLTGLSMNDCDIKVESLLYFKDVKNWALYMYKDMYDWKFTSKFYILPKYYQDVLMCNLGNVTFYYLQINCEFISFEIKNLKEEIVNLNGVKITNNIINQTILIDLLHYYLILNEYYIYNDNIYSKVKESVISYKLEGPLKNILYDNFQENVVNYYINNFAAYFKGFDFSYLLKNYFIKSKSVIESIRDISTQRINPDFGLIEFTDGVYSIKYDRFFSKASNRVFSKKISTIKYYNKSYSRVRRDKPISWINGLKNALNINHEEVESKNKDFVRLCLHIINPIHKDVFNKKATLFIIGKSNTGKTTLIVEPIVGYYMSENIGMVITARNFKFQDLENKKLVIMDEGRYNPSISSDFLKLLGGESLKVEKKYSKDHINIEIVPVIILTNSLFEDKVESINEALKNRLYTIEFINTVPKLNLEDSSSFKRKLKDEESNIIVYCNKLLFKIKKKDYKKQGNKISNDTIIKWIENYTTTNKY